VHAANCSWLLLAYVRGMSSLHDDGPALSSTKTSALGEHSNRLPPPRTVARAVRVLAAADPRRPSEKLIFTAAIVPRNFAILVARPCQPSQTQADR